MSARRNSIVCILAALMLGLFVMPTARAADDNGDQAKAADYTGSWEWTFNTKNGDVKFTLKLKQDGDKVTGTLTGNYAQDVQDGKVDGNKLTFTVTSGKDDKKTVRSYEGTLDGDTITGKSTATKTTGKPKTYDWTATRVKEGTAADDKAKDKDKTDK